MSTQQFVIDMALGGLVFGALVPIAVIVLNSVIDYRQRLNDNFRITRLPHTIYAYIRLILPRRVPSPQAVLRAMVICAIGGVCVAAIAALAFVGLVEVLG